MKILPAALRNRTGVCKVNKRATRIYESKTNVSLCFQKIPCGAMLPSFISALKLVENITKIQGLI